MKLKDLRAKAGKTPEEIAKQIGITTSAYQQIENDIENASAKVLMKLCPLFGVDMQTLLEDDEALAIDLGSPYKDLLRKTNLLTTYVANIPPINNNKLKTLAKGVINEIALVAKKPNLGVFGRSDAGKSHLINYLIGESKLPVQLQPTTSTITILRHLEDRPKWLKDEVVIFGESVDMSRLDDQKYCLDKSRLYKQGDINLLSTDCIHDHELGKTTKAFSCVVYLDANILRACNIIDVPGFANTDAAKGQHSDTEKAHTVLSLVDILIYMSPVTGCFDQTDMPLLRPIFSQIVAPEAIDSNLPVFSNLFFVVSQAANIYSESALENVKNTVTNRIYRHSTNDNGEGLLDVRGDNIGQKITKEALRKRWFSFWTEIPERREPLIAALSDYLRNTLPELIYSHTKKEVKLTQEKSETAIQTAIEMDEKEIEGYLQLLKDYEFILSPEQIYKRFKEIENTKLSLQNMVKDTKQKTISNIKAKMNAILTEEELASIISKAYDDKKEAQEYAPSLIFERLQSAVENIFKDEVSDVEKRVSDKLEKCNMTLNKIDGIGQVEIAFDTKGAFVGTTTGLATVGALSVYASTMGALGGYAVAAQGVGWLSSLGIGFGWSSGTSGIMSIIAAVGGPQVIATAIAVGLAALGWLFFGKSWQKRLAQNILKEFEKEKVVKKILDGIESKFTGLKKTIDKGCDNLEETYHLYLNDIRDKSAEPEQAKKKIISDIKHLKVILDWFSKAPWNSFR